MSIELEPAKLLSLHSLTKEISQTCFRRVKSHLEAMAPLFRPRRILGDHMEGVGKEAATASDRNLADLQSLYKNVAIKPFDLRPELRAPLESVNTQFQLDEWEYTHAIQSPQGWQQIRVTAPLTWVISYSSSYSLGTLRGVVSGNGQRDPEAVRAYILRSCIMNEMFTKLPALSELLSALRYKVEIRKSPQLGELPLVTISAPFKTFRPSDSLVSLAAGIAGGTSFSEIIDLDSVRTMPDPIRDELLATLSRHKTEL